jgi:Raf kinase inhibitor-like YbhB/YbcL family protein
MGKCCHGHVPAFTRAFQQNGHIPSKYTCEGEDISPPLAWEEVPTGAKSLVLIIDDPDAPDPKAPKMVWVHWVVYNIPPDTRSLPEDAGKTGLPQGALLGPNDFKKTGYGGPCSADRPAPLLPQALRAG